MQPQPTVVGASEPELVELVSLSCANADDEWPHEVSAASLVDGLFHNLATAADLEQRREQQALRIRGVPVSTRASKLNRRKAYLDEENRRTWEQRSLQFLARRRDVVAGLSSAALYTAIAMQHYVEQDFVDLSLPLELRSSDDEYAEHINTQFILDASRGRYTIGNVIYHYADVASTQTEEAFLQSIVDALQQAVPSEILAPVSTLMCQSGLAALERASLSSSRLAVCGGEQEVEYTLTVDNASQGSQKQWGSVSVQMQVEKKRFHAYILEPVRGDDDAPFVREHTGVEPTACDAQSSRVRKFATVCFGADMSVDVVDIFEEIDIRRDGLRIPECEFRVPILLAGNGCPSVKGSRSWTAKMREAATIAVQVVCRVVRRACSCPLHLLSRRRGLQTRSDTLPSASGVSSYGNAS